MGPILSAKNKVAENSTEPIPSSENPKQSVLFIISLITTLETLYSPGMYEINILFIFQ